MMRELVMRLGRATKLCLAGALLAAVPSAIAQGETGSAERDRTGADIIDYCAPQILAFSKLTDPDNLRANVAHAFRRFFDSMARSATEWEFYGGPDPHDPGEVMQRMSKWVMDEGDSYMGRLREMDLCIYSRAWATSKPFRGHLVIQGNADGVYILSETVEPTLVCYVSPIKSCTISLEAGKPHKFRVYRSPKQFSEETITVDADAVKVWWVGAGPPS